MLESELPSRTLGALTAAAEAADRAADWPAASWDALRAAGVLRWSIPTEYGGAGLGPVEQLKGNESIAAACLTTAFVLSQREAAVRQLLRGPPLLRERFLPGLAAGDLFATVGLSQLTTSQQHGGPALRATPISDGFRLDGRIPWVTGADRAAVVAAGATLPDGTQLVLALPTDRPGVTVEPPMPLAALAGSRTSSVRCAGVVVERELALAGPAERVLGPVGGGGLETSNLGLGLAAAAVEFLDREAAARRDLSSVAARFRSAADTARGRLHALAVAPDPDETLVLRADCTRLASRATRAALLAAKGAGFVVPHPAQRWARQSLFFLVWSCPRPVASVVLDDLLPAD
jgi:alkylation response protein AidB-like acyl-CoA dehydrogenase